jgi:hypothetical protein
MNVANGPIRDFPEHRCRLRVGRMLAEALKREVVTKHRELHEMPGFALIQIVIDLPEQDAGTFTTASLAQSLMVVKKLSALLRRRVVAKGNQHDMHEDGVAAVSSGSHALTAYNRSCAVAALINETGWTGQAMPPMFWR